MAATSVMTVRIDPQLLAALKARARRDGSTVSAEVVRLVRKEVTPAPARRRRARTLGMFANFEAPELDDLTSLRRALSASFHRTAGGRAKRRR
jgi:hypothetical protein